MPPTDPIDPPVGDIAPYPNDILRLGQMRWLDTTGHIITKPFGDPCELKPNTLAFWEAAALRGTGTPLSDLFGGLDQVVDGRFRELDMLEWLHFEAEEHLAANPDDMQADRDLAVLKERISNLKLDLVIDLGRGGIEPVE